MYDAFDNSGGGFRGRKRSFKKAGPICSASRGVRYGFIADLEQPLAPGVETKRKARRIPASFYFQKAGEWVRVSGDISSGGALVLFDEKIVGNQIRLMIELEDNGGRWEISGQILGLDRRGARFGHHVRFTNLTEVRGLGEAIEKSFEKGENRLTTK